MEVDGSISAVVFDVQRFALHDGPGIRTTVFVKGCPLRCAWCHNPEAMSPQPERMTMPCVDSLDPAEQTTRLVGKTWSMAEVMAVVLRDRAYYERSGGGLTVSGGEPLCQLRFTTALLTAARQQQIHTCLDTSGMASRHSMEAVLPWVDLFLFDYKVTGQAKHDIWTGASERVILGNLALLDQAGAVVELRCPIIPGVNDDEEHFAAIRALRRRHRCIRSVRVMPHHDIGRGKWTALGRPAPDFRNATAQEVDRWRAQCQVDGRT
jgi:pyruvate formate lyase activating enzyme